MNARTNPPDITAIDLLARQYADAQTDLDTQINDLRHVIDMSVRDAWPALRAATTRAAGRYEALLASVTDARDVFEKPKTKILHGVRVGYRKAKDSIQVLNADNTCALIEKHLPDQVDVLISTTKKPVMAGLEQLDDEQLRKIGCKRVAGRDEPIAALAETELDKVVAALMKGAIEKAEAES